MILANFFPNSLLLLFPQYFEIYLIHENCTSFWRKDSRSGMYVLLYFLLWLIKTLIGIGKINMGKLLQNTIDSCNGIFQTWSCYKISANNELKS